jgi:four helix bundle protein
MQFSPLFAQETGMLEKFEVFQMAKQYYWRCKELKIQRILQDQLLRSSSSIALNIAEGSGKRTIDDRKRFYSIALGSLRESDAILQLEKIEDPILADLGDQLGAMLFTLTRKDHFTKN